MGQGVLFTAEVWVQFPGALVFSVLVDFFFFFFYLSARMKGLMLAAEGILSLYLCETAS